jgi:3-methyladenine DNA glycosylase/8-oxoguanine DNA glycosylase
MNDDYLFTIDTIASCEDKVEELEDRLNRLTLDYEFEKDTTFTLGTVERVLEKYEDTYEALVRDVREQLLNIKKSRALKRERKRLGGLT